MFDLEKIEKKSDKNVLKKHFYSSVICSKEGTHYATFKLVLFFFFGN